MEGQNVADWQDKRTVGGLKKFIGALGTRPNLEAGAWNGRDVVVFEDGDLLSATTASWISQETYYTMVIVAEHTAGGDRGIFSMTNGGNPGVRIGTTGGGSTVRAIHRWPVGTTGGAQADLTNVTANDPHIIWVRRAGGGIPELTVGASYSANLTGASNSVDTATNNWDGSGTATLGGATGEGIVGRVAEILVFTTYLDNEAIGELREYLNAKWGVVPPT
jgi:hypothetical protein